MQEFKSRETVLLSALVTAVLSLDSSVEDPGAYK